ncbi:MAG: sugar phosphate isomerase/epimerase family protein [Phycisphaerae bacterium]
MAGQGSIIACRVSSYEPFAARAYEHIAALGLRHVEIPVPAAEALDAVAAELRKFGLAASSLHGECDLSRPDLDKRLAEQMPAFAALDCKLMFTSVRRGEIPADTAYGRLRLAGEVAGEHGVTLALETHPDLVTNADVALQTLRAVDHPQVRLNFDTANVYFYNREVDCVEQLRKVVRYVAAVHLKDTDGGYRHWHFPALGAGIVHFAQVFEVLDEAGFRGPCTLEIEGIQGEEKSERLVRDRVAASVNYLRKLDRI